MNKLTLYPFVIVLLITLAGFYFLNRDKSQLTADIDQLKQQIDSIHQENRQLHIRISALEEGSVIGLPEKAGQTLRKTLDNVLEVIDKKIDETRSEIKTRPEEASRTKPETAPAPTQPDSSLNQQPQ